MIRQWKSVKSCALATSSVAALGFALASVGAPALAQDEPAASERIVVTGSRIVRRDFEASSPIVTIEADTFENQGTVAVESALNRLPQFTPGENQFGANANDVQGSPTNNPGASTLNLRGLGSNRNLVLIDGRRGQPSNASLVIDINTIPAAAIDSVEIISGGASAVYGADAIAGVVNFKLKRDFEGFELDAQYGQTERGDGAETSIGALMGASFDDGRGNAMLGINWSQREAAYQRNREFYTEGWADPGTPGGFSDLVAYSNPSLVAFSFLSGIPSSPSQAAVDCLFSGAGNQPGGCTLPGKGFDPGDVLASAPFSVNSDGTVFSPYPGGGGTIPAPGYTGENASVSGNPFDQFKVLNTNLNPVGGRLDETGSGNINAQASLPLNRYSIFGSAHYDLTDSVTGFLQAGFSQNRTTTILFQAPSVQFWGTDVPVDAEHPVPDELAYLLANRGLTYCNPAIDTNPGPAHSCDGVFDFPFFEFPAAAPADIGTLVPGFENPTGDWALSQNTLTGPRTNENNTNSYQVLGGFEGELPIMDWTWEVYGSHGETSFTTDYTDGWVSQQKLQLVIDAPFYGEGLVLRPNSANPTPGFVGTCTSGLYDAIFEGGTMSQDCEDLISIRMSNITEITQDVVEANFQGGLFDLPAGEVRFAAGAGYRYNDFKFIPDPNLDGQGITSQPIGIFGSNESLGSTDVREAYGELLVPVLADVPLVESFNLELGYRYSDYDTYGGVDTYKALGDWGVTDWLNIRGGFQQATRAANIAELFQGDAQIVVGFGGDPCTSNSILPWGVNEVNNTNATALANARALCDYLLTERVQPGAPGPALASYDPDTTPPFFFGNGPVTIDVTQGNPDVQPETAETITLGAVMNSPFESAFLGGFRVSVDWYQIEVEDAIAPATTSVNYEQCFNADGSSNPVFATAGASGVDLFAGNPFCDNILREAVTGIARIANAPYTNLGGINTSGVDLQVDWVSDLEDVGLGLPGTVSVNFIANVLDKFEVAATPGGSFLDYKGTTGTGTTGGSQFDYKTFTTFGYSLDTVSLGLRWRYLPEIDPAALVTNPASTILSVDDHHEFDLFGRWSLSETVELRGGVDNLMDTDPEIVGANPPGGAGVITNARGQTNGNYDVLGRRFFVGATLRY